MNIVQATYDISPTLSASGRGTERAGESRGQDCVVACPPLSFALTAKGGRFDGESETFVFQTRGGDLSTGHDVAGTLGSNCDRASGGAPMVAHTLRGEGFDAGEGGTGRGTPLVPVAFAQNCRDEVRDLKDLAGALAAEPGMKQQTYLAYAIQERDVSESLSSGPGGKGYQQDIAYTIEARSKVQATVSRYGVRRLLPIECERCQGMPDHWTRYGIDDKGNEYELSDSARYRLIGNSVAVPNVAWIGRRIVAASEQH